MYLSELQGITNSLLIFGARYVAYVSHPDEIWYVSKLRWSSLFWHLLPSLLWERLSVTKKIVIAYNQINLESSRLS